MAGTATNRSNIALPTDLAREVIKKMQEESAIMRLARRINLPGNGVTIPVILGDPEPAWVGETEAKPVSNPSISQKIMQAYKLAVIVPFSNEFRRDVSVLYSELVGRLPRALGKKFDQTVFTGTAPGSNFDVLSGCTAQPLTGAAGAYDALVAADADIADNGGILNGFAISPQAKSILLLAKDGNERPLFINSVAEGAIPMILGAPTYLTQAAYKAGSPNIVGVAGDWTQALYGTVEGVQISISEEATLEVDGNTRINLFQQNMFAVRAEIEVGFRADASCFNLLTASN